MWIHVYSMNCYHTFVLIGACVQMFRRIMGSDGMQPPCGRQKIALEIFSMWPVVCDRKTVALAPLLVLRAGVLYAREHARYLHCIDIYEAEEVQV